MCDVFDKSWYSSSGYGGFDANNIYSVNTNAHTLAYFTLDDVASGLPLNEGDTLSVQFSVAVHNKQSSYSVLRFGLFDSGESRVDQDGTGLANQTFNHYKGYAGFVDLDVSKPLSLRKRTAQNDDLINVGGNYTTLVNNLGDAFYPVNDQFYGVEMLLERTSAGVVIKLSVEGVVGSAVILDSTDPVVSFDTFAIYGSDSGMEAFSLGEVTLEYSGNTILSDTFKSGQRLTESLPESGAVFVSDLDPAINNSGDELYLPADMHALTYFSEEGSELVLDTGDKIVANLKFSLDGPLASSGALRLGLFRSFGNRIADDDGLMDDAFTPYRGYIAQLKLFDPDDGISIRERDTTSNTSLLSAGGAYPSPYLADYSNDGFFPVSGKVYDLVFSLSRADQDTIEISASINGEHCSVACVDLEDGDLSTDDLVKAFDCFAIYGASYGMNGFTLHELSIHHTWNPSQLFLDYMNNSNAHENIGNFSYAGYKYGNVPIPSPGQNIIDVTLLPYGADKTGSVDATKTIIDAIEAAESAGGGVVYFPDGAYKITGTLFINKSNVVLRGESRAGTKLIFENPLETAYGTFVGANGTTRWTYCGGLIWFCPESRATYREQSKVNTPVNSQGIEYDGGWDVGLTVGGIQPAVRGAFQIEVSEPQSSVSAGEFVHIRMTDPVNLSGSPSANDYSMVKHFAGDGPWADYYDWTYVGSGGWLNPPDMEWVVEVASVDGDVITLKQPLRFEIRSEWNPVLSILNPPLTDCGIEHLTLEFERAYNWNESSDHHYEEGWNAPFFNNAINCWLRDVTMIDMDNGPNLTASKNVTLTNFTIKSSDANHMAHHHGTITRRRSHDNLISDFRIESQPWHGCDVESFSTGNVWTRGVLEHGVFDTHRNMPFEGLRTEIQLVNNDGAHGGSSGPLMGARFANWNIRIGPGSTQDYIVGWENLTPRGVIVGLQGVDTSDDVNKPPAATEAQASAECIVEQSGLINGAEPNPSNLYEAQLSFRLQQQE